MESELKGRFEREVSAPNKELLWAWLKQDCYVADVSHRKSGWSALTEAALRLADRQREMLRWSESTGRPQDLLDVHVPLTDLELEHAAALAPYLAKRAALLPEVRDFREEKLDGGTLRPDQIVDFLRNELKRFPWEECPHVKRALEQVPAYLAGDRVEKLKDLLGGWDIRDHETPSEYWFENLRRAVEFDSIARTYGPSQRFLPGLMYLIRDETGRTLEDVGRWLVSRYPWPLRDAAWFVLTNEPPEVQSLEVQYDRARGMYRLIFAPWISEKTIRFVYHSLQSRDNRPLSKKGLSAFRFVDEHTEPGHTPQWAKLTKLWNEQHPEDKFTDRSALRQAYERAKERLAAPWENKPGHETKMDGTDIDEIDCLI